MRSVEVQGQVMCTTNHHLHDYSFVCFHFQSDTRTVLFVPVIYHKFPSAVK